MARVRINYDDFKIKAFLDANIILEGRPLAELPWHEIDRSGPIIALIAPTAMKEVDSKKQDGRIGKRAREFDRLIAPVAAGGPPIVIRERAPRVELALSGAIRIAWDRYDDLDPDDGFLGSGCRSQLSETCSVAKSYEEAKAIGLMSWLT